MTTDYRKTLPLSVFADAHKAFEALEDWLTTAESAAVAHDELEETLQVRGCEMLRLLLQSHLELRAAREVPVKVVGEDGLERSHVRKTTERGLMTVFGLVRVRRFGYSRRQSTSRFPADQALNLPDELYSHGLRRLVAMEAAKGAFDEAVTAVRSHTGGRVAKRQAEQLAKRAARDFDAFYESASKVAEPTDDLLVLSVDGKGIVMRTEDLREETRRDALKGKGKNKLTKRLSRGESSNRKRMTTVASVASLKPQARTPEDVMKELKPLRDASKPRPRAYDKRVWASVQKEPAEVIDDMFREALRRDPEQKRTWVVLVDGAIKQRRLIEEAAPRFGVKVTIVLDFIHMIERIWSAGWRFFEEGDKRIEAWVRERTIRVLKGRVSGVAAGIRRKATLRGLTGKNRKAIDVIANYLLSNRKIMPYDVALAAGWPIATGIIEGACRHLVKDRMDVTGARWSLQGAEAVLSLRALRASNDFDAYWRFHVVQERQRQHTSRYAHPPPTAA